MIASDRSAESFTRSKLSPSMTYETVIDLEDMPVTLRIVMPSRGIPVDAETASLKIS